MGSSTRRILGLGLCVLALGGAATADWVHRGRAAEAADALAQGDIEGTLPGLLAAFESQAHELAARAHTGARLNGVEASLVQSSQADFSQLANTLAAFKDEPFFQPYLAFDRYAYFLGERPLVATDADTAWFLPLVREAATDGLASGVQAGDGAAWLVGVGRSDKANPQQVYVMFALAQKVTTRVLEPLAAERHLSLLVVANEDVAHAIGAGPDEGLATLRTSTSAATTACCARRPLAPGVELRVYRDPKPLLALAANEASSTTPVFFGVGVLLAAVGLVIAFRSGGGSEVSAELLMQTSEQLRHSQEQLVRLSQQLATRPPEPTSAQRVDDGLGATQASVQASRYEVIAPLGEGGMARVAVAVVRGAEGFRRTFVLKRLRPELVSNQEVVNQFIDEARLGASLVHSNIVPVFDFGRDAEGYYLAQEYIVGRDLEALTKTSVAQRGQPLEPAVVVFIAQEGLKALAYAHSKKNDAGRALGLVHRDVSPSNLMVSARGEVKLLDFGIVKSDDRVTKTQAGMVKGNLFFMSPEQAQSLEVDPRSDLYSLGLVLFFMLAGEPLYSGDTMIALVTRAAAGATEADRARVRAACGPLAPAVLRALSLNPADRFADAEEMSRALVQLATPASSADVQRLMELLFAAAFAEERQKFAVQG